MIVDVWMQHPTLRLDDLGLDAEARERFLGANVRAVFGL
jgi:hypothetical protein